MEKARELVCAAVMATLSIHYWIMDPGQRHRFKYPLFVLSPGNEGERIFLISGEGDLLERLLRFINLKRLPSTYAVLPDDGLGACVAFRRDVFILYPIGKEETGESQINWYSHILKAVITLTLPGRGLLDRAINGVDNNKFPLPQLINDAGEVPETDLPTKWRYALKSHYLVPTSIFHEESIVLYYNGTQGAGGHFTLLSARGSEVKPPMPPAERYRLLDERIERFVRHRDWLPNPAIATCKSLVFHTLPFLRRWAAAAGSRYHGTLRNTGPSIFIHPPPAVDWSLYEGLYEPAVVVAAPPAKPASAQAAAVAPLCEEEAYHLGKAFNARRLVVMAGQAAAIDKWEQRNAEKEKKGRAKAANQAIERGK
jgi:hypothetical protein